MPRKFIIISALVLTLAGYFISLDYSAFKRLTGCAGPVDMSVDLLEYHILAANFALENRFPVLGFIQEEAAYNICENEGTNLYFMDMLRENGTVVWLSRPPLYPLLAGFIYKIFGIDSRAIFYFNLLINALIIILLPLIGYRMRQYTGLACGIFASVLFMVFKAQPIEQADPEIFTSFVLLLVFYSASGIRRFDNSTWMIFGGATAMALLTKGLFVFIPVFVALMLVIHSFNRGFIRSASNFLLYGIGMAFVLLPWIIFINIQRADSYAQREEWRKKIEAHAAQQIISNPPTSSQITDYITKYIFWLYLQKPGFILLTNQAAEEAIFMVNNEFCIDGEWHPEWKFFASSYYNSEHLDKPPLIRVLYFYFENPSYLFKNASGKLMNASTEYPLFFWLPPFGGWVSYNLK